MGISIEQQNKKSRYDIVLGSLGTLAILAATIIKLTANQPTFSEHNHLELERGQAAMTQSIDDIKDNLVYIRHRLDKM